MLAKLRIWHWIAIAFASVIILLLLWFGLAYGGLPRLWSHHEHKRIGSRDEIVTYTAQDIPADPVNLRLFGNAAQIDCAFHRASWTRADNVSVRSAIKIAGSVVAGRAYAAAPVSSLYINDRVEDLAYEIDNGRSADRRHHVRLWQVAPDDWLAAATYDRGVGLSLFTLQITHHIGPDVDSERAMIGNLILAAGGHFVGQSSSRIAPDKWHRNGGGDRYKTDGMVRAYMLGQQCDVPK